MLRSNFKGNRIMKMFNKDDLPMFIFGMVFTFLVCFLISVAEAATPEKKAVKHTLKAIERGYLRPMLKFNKELGKVEDKTNEKVNKINNLGRKTTRKSTKINPFNKTGKFAIIKGNSVYYIEKTRSDVRVGFGFSW